ncbi:TonB-dependent receptor domain-containing protein [Novosphingobium beihaiensis]|uniref:TonB-dependent receptor n=1 Tax=Novosphingobium beihaiensis TaxID=2930389 RepID=A0ABT0BW00_9SPHN|nr:TonB-dependent receptor [Novosphingobium beihaiensis]MCJ2189214.1 TonB-dependent receptor [Novosphingobium beihaiensis]
MTANSREELRNVLSPGVVSVVYPDDTRGEHKSLPDLLDQIPGVFVRRVAGTGGYTTTSIRGSAPSQVNIYIDGVPYNTSSEVAADISTIPIENVERVEVYRGTTPARFSGAPLGGAINIVTKRATGLSGTVSGGVRSFGGWQTSANINAPLFGGSLLLGVDMDHSKGDFRYLDYVFDQLRSLNGGLAPDGKPITYYDRYDFLFASYGLPARNPSPPANFPIERRRLNNSFQKDNILVKWNSDHFTAKYSYTYLNRLMPVNIQNEYEYNDLPEYAYPLPASAYGDNYPSVRNPRLQQVQKQHDVALGWHNRFGRLEVAVALNAMDQDKHYANLDQFGLGGLGRFWSDFRTRRYGGQLDLAFTLGKDGPIRQRIELHAQGSQETMHADASDLDMGMPSPEQANLYRRYRRHLVNFQAQDTITVRPLGDLELTPIARVERLFGPALGEAENPFGPSSGDYGWKPTWSISAKKNFGGWLLFADYGTYNRYPNFYEIYGDGVFVQAGSSALGNITPLLREHGNNADIGFGWNGTVVDDLRASFRTTFFRRKTYDTITLYSTPIGGKYINSGTTVTKGVEFEGNLILGKSADLQAAATYQKGHYVEGSYYTFGGISALQRVGDDRLYTLNNPRFTANARLNLHFLDGALTTFGEVKHTGKRYTYQRDATIDGNGGFAYDLPLTTIDLGAHYKLPHGLALSAGVNDVFNAGPRQKAYNPNYYNQFNYNSSETDYQSVTVPTLYSNVGYPQQGRTFYLTIAKSFGAGDKDRTSDRIKLDRSTAPWTGFYAGGSIGRGWQAEHANESLAFDTNANGVFTDYVPGARVFDEWFLNFNGNGFQRGFDGRGTALGKVAADGIAADRNRRLSYGFRAGYDRQIGDWVIGAVGEWASYRLIDAVSGYGLLFHVDDVMGEVLDEDSYAFTRRLNSIASLRLRGGYSWRGLLGYVTGGLARGDVDHGFLTTNTVNRFTERGTGNHRWGYQYGFGLEHRVAGPFTLGVEFLHTRLRDGEYTVQAGVNPDAPVYNGFQQCATCFSTDIKRASSRYEISSVRLTAGIRF